MPELARIPHLRELVIFPIFTGHEFSACLDDVMFKKLNILHFALIQVTDLELNRLFGVVSESCPQLKHLKIDIYDLKAELSTCKCVTVHNGL
jgi:hypothetical protein